MKAPKLIDSLIHTVRGHKVLLDADLAELYGVSTKVFNQAIKRNADRFPADFRFQLNEEENENLRSQNATSSASPTAANQSQSVSSSIQASSLRSQIVTLKTGRGQHRKYLPWAFTEHGAIMAATILNSPKAAAMSVFIVRAFIQMREQLMTSAEVLKRLAQIDKTLLQHDRSLQILWQELQPLLQPPPPLPKRTIGFQP
jgi:hypothetical protein